MIEQNVFSFCKRIYYEFVSLLWIWILWLNHDLSRWECVACTDQCMCPWNPEKVRIPVSVPSLHNHLYSPSLYITGCTMNPSLGPSLYITGCTMNPSPGTNLYSIQYRLWHETISWSYFILYYTLYKVYHKNHLYVLLYTLLCTIFWTPVHKYDTSKDNFCTPN